MNDWIDAYLRHLVAAGYSTETVEDRARLLVKADRELRAGLARAIPADLEWWLGQAHWARWTRYTYFNHFNGFYVWAARTRRLPHNPMSELTRPRAPKTEPRPASEEQVAIALRRVYLPWRVAVTAAAFNGLRCGEIAGLVREEVTQEWLPVRRKGGKEQLLPIHPLVWRDIAELPPGPVVPRWDGCAHTSDQLSAAMTYRLRTVGLPGVTLHWFRHRFATVALLPRDLGGAGSDARTVQELLGHESLASTEVYTRVTSAQRRSAIARLPVPALG